MNIQEWFTKYRKKLTMRSPSFEMAFELLSKIENPSIIETGTLRNDTSDYHFNGAGCSTLLFSDFVSNHGGKFLSVDISEPAIHNAKFWVRDYINFVTFVQADSVSFLNAWPLPIDLIYLDSMDYEQHEPLKTQSQQHSLNELIAVLPKLKKTSIILIDDCDLPGGGKGLLSRAHLQWLGWTEVHNGYQSLWVNNQ